MLIDIQKKRYTFLSFTLTLYISMLHRKTPTCTCNQDTKTNVHTHVIHIFKNIINETTCTSTCVAGNDTFINSLYRQPSIASNESVNGSLNLVNEISLYAVQTDFTTFSAG